MDFIQNWQYQIKYISSAVIVVGSAVAYALMRPVVGRDIPKTMRRLVLAEPSNSKANIEVEELPVPVPRSGEVLVRMSAAPVNPSDYGSWTRKGPGTKYPLPIGNEGSGVVVASGGGMYARSIVGKTVGIIAERNGKQGTYQEYLTVSAIKCAFPIPKDIQPEDACSFFVNPYTAVAITDYVKRKKSKAFVHTAAASQLGQMLVKLCKQVHLTVICVVRRQAQVELLKKIDPDVPVVCQADDDWQDQLKTQIRKHRAKVAFDAISGPMAGTIVQLMPNRSITYVYGGLSNKPLSNVQTMDLIYKGKKVEGFLLPNWINMKQPLGAMMRLRRASAVVNRGLQTGGWATTRFKECTFEDLVERLEDLLAASSTNSKLRIRMGST